jgi:hypothetical protein
MVHFSPAKPEYGHQEDQIAIDDGDMTTIETTVLGFDGLDLGAEQLHSCFYSVFKCEIQAGFFITEIFHIRIW